MVSRTYAVVAVVLLGIVASLCLVTAGDISLAAVLPPEVAIRQNAVLDQHLVSMEVASASGRPTIGEAQATVGAGALVPRSNGAASVEARYVTLTVRNENGGVAWGLRSQLVWLVTFLGVGYPTASMASADCSCLAYFWRPSTVAVVNSDTGAVIVYLGVEN